MRPTSPFSPWEPLFWTIESSLVATAVVWAVQWRQWQAWQQLICHRRHS